VDERVGEAVAVVAPALEGRAHRRELVAGQRAVHPVARADEGVGLLLREEVVELEEPRVLGERGGRVLLVLGVGHDVLEERVQFVLRHRRRRVVALALGLGPHERRAAGGAGAEAARAFAELRHLRRADRRALPLDRAPARAQLVPRLAHLVAVAAWVAESLRLGGGRQLGREEVRRRRW